MITDPLFSKCEFVKPYFSIVAQREDEIIVTFELGNSNYFIKFWTKLLIKAFYGGLNTGFNITEATNFGFKEWYEKYNVVANNCIDSTAEYKGNTCNLHEVLDFGLEDQFIDRSKRFWKS